MARKFNARMRRQEEWGWLLAIWLFLSGTACALFLLYQLARLPHFFGWLSFGLLIAGGGVLLLEQGSPLRAWRAVSRLRTSWLSRGVVFVMAFVVSAALALAPTVLPGSAWPEGFAQLVQWVAGLCALMVILYPGFFLANNRSVPFWYSPMLPVLLLGFAATGAFALVLAGSSRLQGGLAQFGALASWSILATAALLCGYLAVIRRAGEAARESVRLLSAAPLAPLFWGGVVAIGLALPLVLVLWAQSAAALAGWCMLLGCFLFRYCLLKAGVYVPAAIAQQGLDFSRLNRTGTELQREYAAASPAGGRN